MKATFIHRNFFWLITCFLTFSCYLPGISFAQSAHLLGSDLLKQYTENEIAADLAFKDKDIFVSGTIDTIGKDILGTPYVLIDKKGIFGVQCMFQSTDIGQLASLQKGKLVHIIGTCRGKMGNVLLKNCSIFKVEN